LLRIPVRLRRCGKEVEAYALLNTGFESDEPVVAVPPEVASELGLRYGREVMFRGPTLTYGIVYLGERVEVVVSMNNECRCVEAYVAIAPGEDEVILSAKCIELLGIVIDLKHRRWWFS